MDFERFTNQAKQVFAASQQILQRYKHNHGGASATGHVHTNTHYHTIGDHYHTFSHRHDCGHTHTAGDYAVSAGTSGESAKAGSDINMAQPGHSHAIGGSSFGASIEELLAQETFNTAWGGAGTSDGFTATMSVVNPPISTPDEIVPPYTNTYFIIKAIDFSGTYI